MHFIETIIFEGVPAHENLLARVYNVGQFCSEINLEAAAIFIDNLKLSFVIAYYSPSGEPILFLKYFERFLSFLPNG